jgi:hypothetical protein
MMYKTGKRLKNETYNGNTLMFVRDSFGTVYVSTNEMSKFATGKTKENAFNKAKKMLNHPKGNGKIITQLKKNEINKTIYHTDVKRKSLVKDFITSSNIPTQTKNRLRKFVDANYFREFEEDGTDAHTILENFVLYYTSDDTEREYLNGHVLLYLD